MLVTDFLPRCANILTNVSVFVFALGAAAHIADSPDVLFLEADLVVKNSDAVCLHHKGESWLDTFGWVAVVVSVLGNRERKMM